MIKRLKKTLIENEKIRNSLLVNLVYLIYSFIRILVLNGFNFTHINEYRQKKESNVMVILGAGSSVNELTDRQMKELGDYDVVGLSYSCVLNIKQKFYFYESASFHEKSLMQEHAIKVLPAVLSAKKKGIIENIFWKNSENKIFNNYVDMSLHSKQIVCNVLTNNEIIFNEILNWHLRLGLYKYFLVQIRGSVTALMNFAVALKYEKVIFVGIDLNDGGYFFDHSELYDKYNFASPYAVENIYGSDENEHRTNNSKYGKPVMNYIKMMTCEIKNISFYVSSKRSSLSQILNQWNFKK